MVELVDTPDLGSGAERCEGSSPSESTQKTVDGVSLPRKRWVLEILTSQVAQMGRATGDNGSSPFHTKV